MLDRIPLRWRPFVFSLAAFALVLAFHAPRLWLMDAYRPGTFQWDRAHTFLLQVQAPFRDDIEPAMRWRLLPPLLAHLLRLPGNTALAIPWIGAIAAAAYFARTLQARLKDARFVFGGTVLYASTSAGLVSLHLYGVNDAWVWLALMAAAFSPSRAVIVAACLLAPWVDERFIIGLPLAWLTRISDRRVGLFDRELLWFAPVAVYPLARLAGAGAGFQTETGFLAAGLAGFATYAGLIPLAWWMGLRAAIAPIGYVFTQVPPARRWQLGAALVGTALVMAILAYDLSRSVAISIPLVLLGAVMFAERRPDLAPRAAIWLAVAGLLLPTAHVVGRKIDPIENIAVEAMRLIHR